MCNTSTCHTLPPFDKMNQGSYLDPRSSILEKWTMEERERERERENIRTPVFRR